MLKWIKENSMIITKPMFFAEQLIGTRFRFWFFGLFMTSFILMMTIKMDEPRWFGATLFILWQFLFLYNIKRLYLMLKAHGVSPGSSNDS